MNSYSPFSRISSWTHLPVLFSGWLTRRFFLAWPQRSQAIGKQCWRACSGLTLVIPFRPIFSSDDKPTIVDERSTADFKSIYHMNFQLSKITMRSEPAFYSRKTKRHLVFSRSRPKTHKLSVYRTADIFTQYIGNETTANSSKNPRQLGMVGSNVTTKVNNTVSTAKQTSFLVR